MWETSILGDIVDLLTLNNPYWCQPTFIFDDKENNKFLHYLSGFGL